MNRRFWVEVRVSYDGVTEKGEKANMKETWLVRAATFAEAESRATEKVCAYNGVEDVGVEACVKRNIAALWVGSLNGDKFYKVRCACHLVNEEAGKEYLVKRAYLVLSSNMLDAYETFIKCMSDTEFSEIEVLGINLTPIVDVIERP